MTVLCGKCKNQTIKYKGMSVRRWCSQYQKSLDVRKGVNWKCSECLRDLAKHVKN